VEELGVWPSWRLCRLADDAVLRREVGSLGGSVVMTAGSGSGGQNAQPLWEHLGSRATRVGALGWPTLFGCLGCLALGYWEGPLPGGWVALGLMGPALDSCLGGPGRGQF